jgi:hypothetical protein
LIVDFIVAPGILPFQCKSWEDAGDLGQIEASFRENLIAFDGVEFDRGETAVNPAVWGWRRHAGILRPGWLRNR